MESCEEEPQLQIRAATTATIAWTTLKEAYHGRTRTHLLHLFSAISTKFDDRKITLAEHISTFEAAWLHLAQNVATATAGTNSMAAGIKNLTLTDSWKAAMLLQSLLKIQPYLNIVMNIASSEDTPTYANVVIRLKETQYNKVRSHTTASTSDSTATTASAFATSERKSCGYCKSKGRPWNSHWEKGCWSKSDNDKKKQQVNSTTTDENMAENWYGELAFATASISADNGAGTAWAVDNACTSHMTPYLTDLQDSTPHIINIMSSSNTQMQSSHIGTVSTPFGQLTAFVVSQLARRLISCGELERQGAKMILCENQREICLPDGSIIPMEKRGNLYFPAVEGEQAAATITEWHQRYGHLPMSAFRRIPEAPASLHRTSFHCSACERGKAIKPLSKSYALSIRTSRVGQLMYSDLCGPFRTQARDGSKYTISLIDDYSRMTMVRTLNSKDLTATVLPEMLNMFERLFNCSVAVLRTDNGGEHRSKALAVTFKTRGIILEHSVPHHSETNPIAEVVNRVIIMIARTALISSGLPRNLWHEAVYHAVYTKNRLPHTAVGGRSPLEVAKPSIDIIQERKLLRIFGEPVWCFDYNEKDKLKGRAIAGRILGYHGIHGVYKVITKAGKVIVAKSPRRRELSEDFADIEIVSVNTTPTSTTSTPTTTALQTAIPAIVSSSTANRKPQIHLEDPDEFLDDMRRTFPGAFEPDQTITVSQPKTKPPRATTSRESEPRRSSRNTSRPPNYYQQANSMLPTDYQEVNLTWNEALEGEDKDRWEDARLRELQNPSKYDLFEWVDNVPPGHRAIDTKIVCRKTLKQDGTTKFKVRLTGHGFLQVPGKDFTETYAPVAREESWRLILAYGISQNLSVQLYDVESAYFNASLEEDIYIQDPAFIGHRAWKLKKALYGLKQSAKVWYDLLKDLFGGAGFTPIASDPAVFAPIQPSTNSGTGGSTAPITGLCCSVVDDLLCALEPNIIPTFEQIFMSRVTLERKGCPKVYLGMELHWVPRGVLITGSQMIQQLATS